MRPNCLFSLLVAALLASRIYSTRNGVIPEWSDPVGAHDCYVIRNRRDNGGGALGQGPKVLLCLDDVALVVKEERMVIEPG